MQNQAAEVVAEVPVVEESQEITGVEAETGDDSGDQNQEKEEPIEEQATETAEEVEQPEMELPDFPSSGTAFNYNPEEGVLYTVDGNPAYRLNAESGTWEPFIAEDMTADFPAGSKLAGNDIDGWQVVADDGTALYNWNADTLTWDKVASEVVTEPEVPAFPTADFEWNYNADTGEILTPDGTAAYTLDADNGHWVPVIPADLTANLSANTQPVSNEDGDWVVPDADGNPQYVWNAATMNWDMVVEPVVEEQQTAPAQVDCPLALPPRLEIGQTARVMTNLNLRDSPGIENNLSGSLFYNSQIEVVGGPECLPHQEGAYMWWQVEKDDGITGWAAEGSIGNPFYFLEPIE